MRKPGNGEIKIDRGIPLPRRKAASFPRPQLSDMKAGDSFFIPGATQISTSAVRMESRVKHIPITTRTVTENGVKGIRIWRIA